MTEDEHFASALETGPERFLSEVLEHTLEHGRRTADDFLRHFPPTLVMEALEEVPELRANFLTALVGVRERTALRTPASDGGRLIEAALEEGDTNAAAFVKEFSPDDRIRYLPARLIWIFLTEDDFWKVSRSKDTVAHKAAQKILAFWVDRGVSHGLHTHQQIVEGITVETLADKLPRAELAKALKRALDMGHEQLPYTEADLYSSVPATTLVDHVALPHIMDNVILPFARRASFLEPPPPPKSTGDSDSSDAEVTKGVGWSVSPSDEAPKSEAPPASGNGEARDDADDSDANDAPSVETKEADFELGDIADPPESQKTD